ncbi:hypothetical protein SLA2020_186200 [Shorea laevis]
METMIMGFIFLPMLLMQCFMAALAMSQPNLTTDQYALLQFKAYVTSDPLNIMSSNWSSSATSICNWVGVSCGAFHSRVTALDLPNMNLTGSLPPHLGNLSFLVSINLSGNSFNGHLPPELGKLQRLKFMDLSFNFLDGSIPDEIWLLSKLETFSLGSNQLTGAISRNIGNLTKLRIIYLGHTKIGGEIPNEIGNLHKLEVFSARNASLSGLIPPNIFNISSLRGINLYINNLSGTLPVDLCYHLPNLKELDLGENQLNGSIPSSIGRCKKLQRLGLGANRFTGYIPRSIGNLSKLTGIYLFDNDFEGEIPNEIGNLHKLEVLSARNASLSGLIPPNIFNISSLRGINLYTNNLSGTLPVDLCYHLPNLKELDLGKNQLNGSIPSSIGRCKKLQRLGLGANRFTGYIPRSIGNLSKLTGIYLFDNDFEGEIPKELGNLQNLEILSAKNIEYTAEAVDNRGTVVGIKSKDGIVMGVEKVIASKMMLVVPIGESTPFIVTLACVYGEPIPVKELAERVASYVRLCTLYWWLRPFGCGIILGGYDREGPQLYMVEPSGISYRYFGAAIGKGKQLAKTEIEKLKLSEMTCREGVIEVAKIIYKVHDEAKDKAFELEMSWICDESKKQHEKVSDALLEEAKAAARAALEEMDAD